MDSRGVARWAAIALALGPLAAVTGCVTVAEFRKLEREVIDMNRAGGGGGPGAGSERLADLAAQVESLEAQIARLEGRVEMTEHDVGAAVAEARAARADAASAAYQAEPAEPVAEEVPEGTPEESGDDEAALPAADDVRAYRAAYRAWRSRDLPACIDQFRQFLQNYPDSAYADDATYWMADCYFKDGDFKTAILRFDAVVVRYPTGNKAADALYREGEALLRLGRSRVAGRAFERVLREYPDSARAPEAQRQLDLLGSG